MSGSSPTPASEATLTQRLAALGVAFVLWLFCALPESVAYGLANLAAPIMVWVTRRREQRISKQGRGLFRNQQIVFREGLTRAASEKLFRRWAKHMTHLVVDFCRLPRLTPHNLTERVDMAEFATLRALYDEGNGVICASGHIGAFELGGHVTALCGLTSIAVSRPPDNPAIGEVLRRHRARSGLVLLPKWGVLWSLRKALLRGELVALAADENDRSKSPVFVPFLGTVAATTGSPAVLQRNTGAPIAVVTCNRVGRGRYRFHVWDVIRNPKSRETPPALDATTRRISAALSRAVLAYPEQWFWGSRRFQTRPPGEVLGPDGLPPPAPPPVGPPPPPDPRTSGTARREGLTAASS